jgi:hypothetical protein
VRIPGSPEFEHQRRRFALRFTCEACAHFERDAQGCSFGFPDTDHRDARYRGGPADVVFCKAFELE